MRPTPALALAAAAALIAAGCSASPCQKLGERLCSCSGLSSEQCTTQVEQELNRLNPPQATMDICDRFLGSCSAPDGATLCEWILTQNGKVACGLAPEIVTTTSGG